ncbi:MAG: hypothetical protein MPW14_14175 [Candidatus Manganitrophus sp.]|nr:MAG: hypothetical protein MPW14_14175 [Candidatus Manganitrophus sp.]
MSERNKMRFGQAGDGEEAEENDPEIGADHVDLAVGEVDQPHDAVDHRVAERHQRVHRAEREAVDQLL